MQNINDNSIEHLRHEIYIKEEELREEKTKNYISSTVNNLQENIQNRCKYYLKRRFGLCKNLKINMHIQYPEDECVESIIIESANIDICPYSVFYFVRIIDNWTNIYIS